MKEQQRTHRSVEVETQGVAVAAFVAHHCLYLQEGRKISGEDIQADLQQIDLLQLEHLRRKAETEFDDETEKNKGRIVRRKQRWWRRSVPFLSCTHKEE